MTVKINPRLIWSWLEYFPKLNVLSGRMLSNWLKFPHLTLMQSSLCNMIHGYMDGTCLAAEISCFRVIFSRYLCPLSTNIVGYSNSHSQQMQRNLVACSTFHLLSIIIKPNRLKYAQLLGVHVPRYWNTPVFLVLRHSFQTVWRELWADFTMYLKSQHIVIWYLRIKNAPVNLQHRFAAAAELV